MQPAPISLDRKQQDLIERLMRSGRYLSTRDVVSRGLELLEEHELQAEGFIADLERQIGAGLDSGNAEPMEKAAELIAGFRRQKLG